MSPHANPVDSFVDQFVEHWGMMARAWGINTSMGELFALLYVTGIDWTADDLKERLGVSRGNVSMNLRELVTWGVVHKVHQPGERRELFRAESDVWTLFRSILRERKRRELDPTLRLLDASALESSADPTRRAIESRVEALRHFFRTTDTLASALLSLAPGELDEIVQLLGQLDSRADRGESGE